MSENALLPPLMLTAIVPAYNEAGRIGSVLAQVQRYVGSIVVVDDGSDDGTAAEAEGSGAEVVRHARRRGKGSAMRSGLDRIRGRGHRYVLFLDADGQHDPAAIPDLLGAAETQRLDIVIGHRLLDRGAHQPIRYYTNLVACNMLSRWIGHEVLDSQSGFRLIRAASLVGITLDAQGFEIETEMLLKLCRRGARLGHVEVRGIAPSRKSRLRPIRDVTRICFSAVKYQYLAR